MKRTSRQVGEDARLTRLQSEKQKDASALQRVLANNAEELLWLAEVMTGSRQAGEQCLAEAVALGEESQYVGREWMLPWLKRLLVHVALKRMSGEIRELLIRAGGPRAVPPARVGASAPGQRELRSTPAQKLVVSFDVLERACLILHGYLDYPMLDCALLLGCPRAWIEAICERVLITAAAMRQPNQDGFQQIDCSISTGVTECAG